MTVGEKVMHGSVGAVILAAIGAALHQFGYYINPYLAQHTPLTVAKIPADSLWWIVVGALHLLTVVAVISYLLLVLFALVVLAVIIGEWAVGKFAKVAVDGSDGGDSA